MSVMHFVIIIFIYVFAINLKFKYKAVDVSQYAMEDMHYYY